MMCEVVEIGSHVFSQCEHRERLHPDPVKPVSVLRQGETEPH